MPEQARNLKEIWDAQMNSEMRASDMPAIISRISQPSPKKYGLADRVDDALYKKGIGAGSRHTMVDKDRADARASLMKFIQNEKNIEAFQNLPAAQKQGIVSLIKGGL